MISGSNVRNVSRNQNRDPTYNDHKPIPGCEALRYESNVGFILDQKLLTPIQRQAALKKPPAYAEAIEAGRLRPKDG